MVQRNANADDNEPEQSDFERPSEKEHLFQVADIFDQQNCPEKMTIDDPDIVVAKLEIVGGEEAGRTLLNRCTLDDNQKAFYYTRMFLKAIGEKYKGKEFPIDSDNWQGKQFYATVKHDGKYANIDQYNFEKLIDNTVGPKSQSDKSISQQSEAVAWDE